MPTLSKAAPRRSRLLLGCATALAVAAQGCGTSDSNTSNADPVACAAAVSDALAQCLDETLEAELACFTGSLSPCDVDDSQATAATEALVENVEAACADGGAAAAGFGAGLTAGGFAAQLAGVCRGEAQTLGARVFGGPHAKLLQPPAEASGVGSAQSACLESAYRASADLLQLALDERAGCVEDACDPNVLRDSLAASVLAAASDLDPECADLLPLVLGVSPQLLLDRAVRQAECAFAAGHADTLGLAPSCGPQVAPPLERGVPTQVVLDGDIWGTRCGDGSPYAFDVRLAPEGFPVGDVVFVLQGGGVCLRAADCAQTSDALFSALEDSLPPVGVMNPDPDVNPFANWTHVWLPYCTQDVFAGGGAVQLFPGRPVARFGAVDVQAAMAMVRNILWAEMNATGSDGYRPERLRILLSGVSAGGFGVLYNYHYALDELRWKRTAAAPDSALALDSGSVISIRALGVLGQRFWRSRIVQAPYCQARDCTLGPVIAAAHSERLLADPIQQLLQISPQADGVQRATTGFASPAEFVNAVRGAYCRDQGSAGLHWYLDDIPSERHVLLLGDDAYFGSEVAGTSLPTWLEIAMNDPEQLTDAVAEGNLGEAFAGVEPFDCAVD